MSNMKRICIWIYYISSPGIFFFQFPTSPLSCLTKPHLKGVRDFGISRKFGCQLYLLWKHVLQCSTHAGISFQDTWNFAYPSKVGLLSVTQGYPFCSRDKGGRPRLGCFQKAHFKWISSLVFIHICEAKSLKARLLAGLQGRASVTLGPSVTEVHPPPFAGAFLSILAEDTAYPIQAKSSESALTNLRCTHPLNSPPPPHGLHCFQQSDTTQKKAQVPWPIVVRACMFTALYSEEYLREGK